jgi:DUF1680 family protein
MKNWMIVVFCILTTTLFAQEGPVQPYINPTSNANVVVRGLGMEEVKWTPGFWKDRFDLNENNVIPAEWNYFMNFSEDNFKILAGEKKSKIGFQGTNWQDGDYYKWLEAQISLYAINKNPQLLKEIQHRAHLIADAQAKDGYITTHTQIGYGLMGPKSYELHEFKHPKRFATCRFHETYNMGHLMTLATTHYRVTGDSTLLNVAIKVGDFLDKQFPTTSKETSNMDFNPTHIMGLMELYRCTKDQKYLDVANRFVTSRGMGRDAMNQNATPLREETHAVGHAVLATVLYNGAADLCAETGDKALLKSLKAIWEDIYTRKASVTGGLGNVHNGVSPTNRNTTVQEAFGSPYSLANSTAYNETCASFYGAFFSWRMFLLTGDAKYVDQMEISFYNNLSSMALDGKSYFYTNVLRWYGKNHPLLSLDHNQRWTNQETCVCCPTSIARFLAQTNDYAYAKKEGKLFVTLYGSNIMSTEINGKRVTFDQTSDYPISGKSTFNFSGELHNDFSLMLRIPAWAKNSYYTINGEKHNVEAGTFAQLKRIWKHGDKVELYLDMKPRLIQANPLVEELRNQVAVAYGPLIYCAETSKDIQASIKLPNLLIPSNPEFKIEYKKDMLGGINEITVENAYIRESVTPKDKLYSKLDPVVKKTKLNLIPYYTWSNRGISEMTVFLPIKWE